jgi:RNA polymerase sigma-70 factor (ECF subfamily)
MTSETADNTLREELAALHEECWGWALACCRGVRDTAEEVLHMSYHKVLDQRARHDGRSSFKTWLFSVIRYTALEHQRWSFRWFARLVGLEAAAARTDAGPPVAEMLQRSERCEEVRAALRQLASRQAEVVRLIFYHDLTLDDAAQVMRVSPGSARKHYERGKSRLRQILKLPTHE